ncbi:hypothetical protein SSE37_24109 [Sagittula stellata E-37]|uniref:Uncharacterized protein n=1 Tax=Sagittula stellata (strain ATCC 700073 / DSM 11524 / E-37) TaxID=388399 RepID=A3K0R7_SAGS3|nr:hypothetical protein SSE37_24109 [Sagittula stellata E-37]
MFIAHVAGCVTRRWRRIACEAGQSWTRLRDRLAQAPADRVGMTMIRKAKRAADALSARFVS